MPFIRYAPSWSIPNAGPAFSVLHFRGDEEVNFQPVAAAVRAFYAAHASYLPDDVSVTFPAEYSVHDDNDGSLTGGGTVTPPAGVPGTSSGSWAAGAGYRVDWATDTILAGRRVRGRTFFVPAAGVAFGAGGIVSSTLRPAIGTAAATFIGACSTAGVPLIVWSRNVAMSGVSSNVTSGSVPALAATLRERKA